MTTSIFAASPEPIPDPLFKITEQFNKDPNPKKVNLGVGIFKDENGDAPFFRAVIRAKEKALERLKAGKERAEYLALAGLPSFCDAIPPFVLGEGKYDKTRTFCIQTLGGSGALSIATRTLTLFAADTKKIFISSPTWPSHRTISIISGAEVGEYPYLNASKDKVDIAALCSAISKLPEKSVLILHASSHNPSGMDPTQDEWREIAKIVETKNLFPIIDSAYQGLGAGLDEDVWIVRHLLSLGVECFVATSFSKSMGLYNHRVGALTYFGPDAKVASKMYENIKSKTVRGTYSNPPSPGADCAAAILNDPNEKALWLEELAGVRERIVSMRREFASRMRAQGHDFGIIEKQRGMFSYTGLSIASVEALRKEASIYMTDDGRMNVAGLNLSNIDYVCESIAAVLSKTEGRRKEVA